MQASKVAFSHKVIGVHLSFKNSPARMGHTPLLSEPRKLKCSRSDGWSVGGTDKREKPGTIQLCRVLVSSIDFIGVLSMVYCWMLISEDILSPAVLLTRTCTKTEHLIVNPRHDNVLDQKQLLRLHHKCHATRNDFHAGLNGCGLHLQLGTDTLDRSSMSTSYAPCFQFHT